MPPGSPRRLCSCSAYVVVLSAPVSTGFALVALAILFLDGVHQGDLTMALAVYPIRHLYNLPWDVYRLLTWPLVHRNFSHAWGNLTTLLLIGPPLEERLGSRRLACVLAVTAAVTGGLHAALFTNGLIGASGLVMCLLLISASQAARFSPSAGVYELPLSFVILAVTYVSRELAALGQDDGISRVAHLGGVALGLLFALRFALPAADRGAQPSSSGEGGGGVKSVTTSDSGSAGRGETRRLQQTRGSGERPASGEVARDSRVRGAF